ncbi:MAG TPA: hypothetical protein PLS95_09285 [Thermoanaerobaculales bacterium]|nr:hypothetical protein [Thermoanaerobaculales bacterium]HQN94989.1 hypothetical protein [Thermoanaerobaculales bacterium]HQP44115.1 hypothetical protein [Thermoanaerobaculales bacterium]
MKTQQRLARSAALIVISVCTIAPPLPGQTCPEPVARWPYGPSFAVDASSRHAYFGSGTALLVADVGDPSSPQVVGRVTLPGFPQDVAVVGGFAFVAAEEAGLRVIDLGAPVAPREVAFLDTPGSAIGVAVAGGYAYVADDDSGLRVIDVRTPSAPVEVGFVDTPNEAVDVAISGSHAYVADWEAGLRVIDVSAPFAPLELGYLNTPDYASGVAVAGSYAYLAGGGSGLRVIDVGDPSAPVEVSSFDTPGFSYRVAVAGRYAYVADWASGLRVIDVETPSAPVEVGFLVTPGAAWSVALATQHAYVAAEHAGLRVLDVSLPSAPVEVGSIDTPGETADVAVSRGYVYVADSHDGLRVLDVTTSATPTVVGFAPIPGNDVAVANGYACIADEQTGLHVVDVTRPSSPIEVGSLDTPGFASGIAALGSLVYVADWYSLRIIDVSTPSAPVEVGVFEPPGLVVNVAVSGSHAYLAGYSSGGLRVLDVLNPSAPVEVGFVDTPGTARAVAVSRGFAYVADGGAGLRVIDVSTPSDPVEVGFVDTPGAAMGVTVSRGFAYVADAEGGLRAIDVQNPSSPLEVGFDDTPGTSYDAATWAGLVLLADGNAGVAVLQECGQGPDAHESFIPAAAVAAGAEGSFFQTDVEVNNDGAEEAQVYFEWLPRGQDNSAPRRSATFALGAGKSLRFENALTTLFELGPDALGALKVVSSTTSVIGMSRTYNTPGAGTSGTFGQGLPAVRATEMIAGAEPQRIIFLSENPDFRTNVGCVNGSSDPIRINIRAFDDDGTLLDTRAMDLGPWSNNQINRVFGGWTAVNGYVDVWADSEEASYYCYGSLLDNHTSDPTTLLPQVPLADTTFVPAAAFAAGLEGSFFETDLDLSNAGRRDITYELLWLPRGADNSDPLRSRTFALAPGAGVRYANVLNSVFGLEPDQVGALAIEASGTELLAMSRTYNLPPVVTAGTFGQGLPAVRETVLIGPGQRKRILFLNESTDFRSNVGCQNGSRETVRVFLELYDSDGNSLETKVMDLKPRSNNQITRVFRDHAPIEAGYVDVWTHAPGGAIHCYGSVLDNLTSDPTTVLPQ